MENTETTIYGIRFWNLEREDFIDAWSTDESAKCVNIETAADRE